jgi:hypothetical protein
MEATAISIQNSRFLVKPSGFNPVTPYTVATHVPVVDYLAYPKLPYNAYWSQWGTGCVLANGKVYSACGDEVGINGNSFLYEYNPATKLMRCVADMQEAVADFKPTDYGFGKVHGKIQQGIDGWLYFTSWWGLDPDNPAYVGDRAFRYNPVTEKIEDLGVTIPGFGSPSTQIYRDGMIMYGGFYENNIAHVDFAAYDLTTRQVLFKGDHEGLAYDRELFVDAAGNAYFNNGGGTLRKYDPRTNSVSSFPALMPGDNLRRTTEPDSHGMMYGVTQDIHAPLFRLDPATQTITPLATLWTEVIAMTQDPTERYIYYTSGIMQDASAGGFPVVQVDLQNNCSQKVIAFLGGVMTQDLHYVPQASYNMTISDDGRTLYIGYLGRLNNYMHDAFVAVHIPEGEAVFVPEPTTLALLTLAAPLLLRRRRKAA